MNLTIALFSGFAGAAFAVLLQQTLTWRVNEKRALRFVRADLAHLHEMLELWMDRCDESPHDIEGPIIPQLRAATALHGLLADLPPHIFADVLSLDTLIVQTVALNAAAKARLLDLRAGSESSKEAKLARVKTDRITCLQENITEIARMMQLVDARLHPVHTVSRRLHAWMTGGVRAESSEVATG